MSLSGLVGLVGAEVTRIALWPMRRQQTLSYPPSCCAPLHIPLLGVVAFLPIIALYAVRQLTSDVLKLILTSIPASALPALIAAKNEAGSPAVHWAVLNNHVACVQALVEVPETSGGGVQVLKVGVARVLAIAGGGNVGGSGMGGLRGWAIRRAGRAGHRDGERVLEHRGRIQREWKGCGLGKEGSAKSSPSWCCRRALGQRRVMAAKTCSSSLADFHFKSGFGPPFPLLPLGPIYSPHPKPVSPPPVLHPPPSPSPLGISSPPPTQTDISKRTAPPATPSLKPSSPARARRRLLAGSRVICGRLRATTATTELIRPPMRRRQRGKWK